MVRPFEDIIAEPPRQGVRGFEDIIAGPPAGKASFEPFLMEREKPPGVWGINQDMDNLFSGRARLSDLMPMDIKYDIGRVAGFSDPEEAEARAAGAIMYRVLFDVPPEIAFDNLDSLNEHIFGKALSPTAAWRHNQELYRDTRSWKETIDYGLEKAQMSIGKSFAGKVKFLGEFLERQDALKYTVPIIDEWLASQGKKMDEWSDMMLAAVNEYYTTNTDKLLEVTPGLGYRETLRQYISEPKKLVRGLIESGPIMIDGLIGTAAGGPVGGVAAMAQYEFGQYYADARAQGTEPMDAFGQAMLTSTIDAVIEEWTLGRKLGLAKNFRKIVADGLPKVAWETTKAFFRGTAEEGSQQFNQNFWRWVFTDRSQQWTEGVKESAAAGGPMEMAMAGVYGGAGLTVGPSVDIEQQNERLDKIEYFLTNAVADEKHRQEVSKIIETARADVEKGVHITAEDVETERKAQIERAGQYKSRGQLIRAARKQEVDIAELDEQANEHLKAIAAEGHAARERIAAERAKPAETPTPVETKPAETPAGEETAAAPKAPAVPERSKIETLKSQIAEREAGQTDEQLSGITKKRRRTLIKETAEKIKGHDIYQAEAAGIEQRGRQIGPGFYYVSESGRGEVEAIIGKIPKGAAKTKVQRMFTFNRADVTSGRAVAWDTAVQEGLETETEQQASMDLSEFVQRVKDAVEQGAETGGLNRTALGRFAESGYPDAEMLSQKLDMLRRGSSDIEINEMIMDWAERNDIPVEAIADELVNPEKFEKLHNLSELDREAELDRIATEQVLAEQQIEAQNAARDVLEANDIRDVEIEPIGKIEADEAAPFERGRGPKIYGAAFTQGEQQIIQLAMGADLETGFHEGWHILRSRLTDQDIASLQAHYGPGIAGEEREAADFARYAKDNSGPSSVIKRVFAKIKAVLSKIRSALAGRGIRTPADIFGEALAGKVKKNTRNLANLTARFEIREEDTNKLTAELQQLHRHPARKKGFLEASEAEVEDYFKKLRNYAVTNKVDEVVKLIDDAQIDFDEGMLQWSTDASEGILGYLHYDQLLERNYIDKQFADVKDLPRELARQLRKERPREIKENRKRRSYLDAIKSIVNRKSKTRFETSGERMRREAEQRARINARKERLRAQLALAPKKVPKARRGRIKLDIREELTPGLTPQLEKALQKRRADLPGAEERPLKTKTPTSIVFDQKWFDRNMKRQRKSVQDSAGSQARRAFVSLERKFTPMSTRLYNIAPELFRATRKYVYDILTRTAALSDDVTPMVKAIRKFSKQDRRQMDLALKQSVDWKINQLVEQYGIREQYDQARAALDEIYDAARTVGIDIEYMKDYWPRILKDPEGFLMYFQGRDDWSIIEQAIKRRAEQAGRRIEDLTVDEKAHVVNVLLRGYRTQGLTLSRPGPAKERTVEAVTAEIDPFYEDSLTAVYKYVKLMNAKIAEREFFGRETREIQNLRKVQSSRLTRLIKLKRRVGLKGAPEPKYKEHISKTAEAWKAGQERLIRLKARSLADTIGGYVMRLQAAGQIQPSQEKQIQDILTGIFDPTGMGSKMGMFATAIYIDTLNSPLQALTQLDEFAYSFYRSPSKSIAAAITTIARQSKIRPQDIGIVSVGEEFQGPSLHRALGLMLKVTGFEQVDRLNKENYLNTVFRKYRAQARRAASEPQFVKRLERVFGDKYQGVIDDLKRGQMSDDVKYLLFNELLDIQPLAISEMPESYAKAGNWRLVYSLKSFYIRRLDFIRNECLTDMKRVDTFARGFGRLVWLSFAFATLGAGSDFLKDFIKGRKFNLSDSMVDNLLRMVFFSKYQAWRTREKGFGTAVIEGWRPPTKAIDAVTRDIINTAKGKDRGWELWRSVPVVGEEYYWWFGGGAEKNKNKSKGKKIR